MPEFLERRYNKSSRMYLTSISIVAYILTKISVTLFAGGLLLNKILGWDMITSSVVLVIVTGIYTIAGGLGAVIYTELMQAVVLIGGSTILTLLGLHEVGGFSGLYAKLPQEFFSYIQICILSRFPMDGDYFWCSNSWHLVLVYGSIYCSEGIKCKKY